MDSTAKQNKTGLVAFYDRSNCAKRLHKQKQTALPRSIHETGKSNY